MRKWQLKEGVVECKGERVTNLAEAVDALNNLEKELDETLKILEATQESYDECYEKLETILEKLTEIMEGA